MKDNRHVLRGSSTVIGRLEIALHHFDPGLSAAATREDFDLGLVTGRPGEAAQVAESKVQEKLYQSRPNEAGCACHEEQIVPPDNMFVAFHPASL